MRCAPGSGRGLALAEEMVVFKGTREGVLIRFPQGLSFDELMNQLLRRIEASLNFFKGSNMRIYLEDRGFSADQKDALEKVLHDKLTGAMIYFGLPEMAAQNYRDQDKRPPMRPVLTSLPAREPAAEIAVPLAPSIPEPRTHEPVEQPLDIPDAPLIFQGIREGLTRFVQTTVRGGQRVEYAGNVVVLGDVNPGGEVVAGGNIIVMGIMRGMAHAGLSGNTASIVAAWQLLPKQLRIASLISRAPEGDHRVAGCPEVAMVKGGVIVIEPYAARRF